ncbi:PHP domain-containing protein [Chitinimonas arctica]|uniref:PHP domain-containing protein n=1 Tax=Chitinimonas arctica TaxID=2594795 RepID=A0A516SC69_9NEIS|nr:3',5'-nucleoside bisphosphate phosphatase [Chitinimonas arctica]QDQ25743.1 PHP domain-containing protein [Chitinimonas arctica]
MLYVDLHAHSNISDGMLPPREVVARAHGRGCQLFALTDHDDVRGLADAADEAARLGMGFVPGVEISVSWRKHTLHIIGLGFDPRDEKLLAGLKSVRLGRDERAVRMDAELAKRGIPGVLEGARKFADNPEMIGRAHFARYLIELGKAKNMQGVFKKYLARGKPGYVSHQWASLEDAVAWIREAGGVAVIAHPGRYEFGKQTMGELIEEFKAAGGEGIEVVSGSHHPDDYLRFAKLAETNGLLASVGTDYHATGEGAREPGALPDMPSGPTPVWDRWRDRIAAAAA